MNMLRRLVILFSGLIGAAGVAAAAAGTHMNPDPNVTTAAYFLMLGAAGATAAAGLGAARGFRWSLADLGGAVIALGAALFGGTLIARALWQTTIFPMAAPTGGTMLILGWLMVGLAAFERASRPA